MGEAVDSQIDVRLLGHLEVEVRGERVEFEGVKQRRLFAALALRVPEAVSTDELVEALWGNEPPGGAAQALQKQISRLRRRLGEGESLVRHRPPGYALDIDSRAIDFRRFEELLSRGRAALGRDDPGGAAADLRTALALWRGEALADYRFDEFAQREIARLGELRVEAIEERLAADLAAGGGEDLVGELQALVAEHPLRERLRGHLMVALYRGGRQAEALEVMRAGRQLLVDELGLEPGPELRRLERMILAHDSALTADRASPGLVGRLPAPANETVGRRRELVEIGQLLVYPDVRLVTLVGPGGVGKTRLAMEAARAVAARFPAGAVHVSLDGAEDAGVLVPEAASALGVVAATAAELGARLAVMTRRAPALLVLDGFDRYVEDAGQVGELLASVANLTVLATSREPLRLTAEHVYGCGLWWRRAPGRCFGRAPGQWWATGRLTTTARSSMTSAHAWTACRSRSSWLRTAHGCSRCARCWSAWSTGSSCSPGDREICPSGSGRCVPRSSGPGMRSRSPNVSSSAS